MTGHLPSEIKKIIPFNHSSPTADVGSYFESVIQDEVWIRVKMDQMAAQFVACGLNHESSILIDYWRERLYAANLGQLGAHRHHKSRNRCISSTEPIKKKQLNVT